MDAGYDVTVERSTQRIFEGMYSNTRLLGRVPFFLTSDRRGICQG